eukprot:TRINITY_DN17685_c0_g1_i1.p1 TRINITY_DN17685_c0_g1~~TRINITY_DN17685_c0_g1_i1.p1  ORF type:complete len:209 (-),score=16.91 TRINITY_DN17685_c0_g1_i1:21-566(-)
MAEGVTPVQFSYFYSREGNDERKHKRQEYVVRRVQEEYRSRKSMDLHLPRESAESFESRMRSEEGGFRISGKDIDVESGEDVYFRNPKNVLWRQIGSAAYILVCEEEENRALGMMFLNQFIRIIDDHFKKPGIAAHPKDFLGRAEEFIILLQTYLPNGLLLFSNQHFTKQLRKDSESLLSK